MTASGSAHVATEAPVDPTTERLGELRAAHMELSEYDWEFRQLALRSPQWQSRASFAEFENPGELLTYRLQSWPTFVDRARIDELARISVEMCRLIKSIPQRVFRGDVGAIDAFYGIGDQHLTEVLFDEPNGIDGAVSRGDFINGVAGLKCIEFNLVVTLGGWETAILAQMHLRNPLVVRMIRDLKIPLSYYNTVRILFSHVLQGVSSSLLDGDDEINIAVIDSLEELPEVRFQAFQRYLREEYATVLRQEGDTSRGKLFLCDFPDLTVDLDSIVRHGCHRIHILVEMNAGETPPLFYRCFKAGTVNLYNGPVSKVLSDKRNIALLSDDQITNDFSEEERAFLNAHVPWTRLVEDKTSAYGGEIIQLPDFIGSHRMDLVLKNTLLCGGKQVYVGRFTSASEWSDVLRTALEQRHWVVQEYYESLPYLFQNGEHGCSPHHVIWGPFVLGQRYAGAILRMQPIADKAIVNLSLTASEGMIFEVEEPDN